MAMAFDTATLHELVDAATRTLAARHPTLSADVVDSVVRQAAVELASGSRSAPAFAELLHRRADARLCAKCGVFTPIRAGRRTEAAADS
ncbi:hypothetical protein [Actinokineospora sp.]|uniref:hypothetical protein n=1 Tax=Actinokineospora sp. TaxID=1872133 RepID=UPI004037DEEE